MIGRRVTASLPVCLAASLCCGYIGAKARIVLRICDETGASVVAAKVDGGFWSPYAKHEKGDAFHGYTDAKGLFLARGTAFSDMGYGVSKSGYYPTYGRVQFTNSVLAEESGRWERWGATNIVILKRIRNPVPTYSKTIDLGRIPRRDEFVGYDFKHGDWVLPYGKGENADLEFLLHFHPRATNRVGLALEYDARVEVRSPTPGGGIIVSRQDTESGSEMRTLYEAPAEGYVREVQFSRHRTGGRFASTSGKDQCLYFRTRTKTDAQGAVTNAWYGTICGDIQDRFTYYLNPDGTRNIEFDLKRNSFPAQER